MKNQFWRWLPLILLVGIVWLTSAYLAGQNIAQRIAASDPGPPTAIHDVTLAEPEIDRGGVLVYTMHATRLRDECEFLGSERFLTNPNDQDERHLLSEGRPAQQLARGQTNQPGRWIEVSVPERFTGTWHFNVVLNYSCPELREVRPVPSPFLAVRIRSE